MSIISDKYKCIFIRIPKTATTSIEHAFNLNDPGSVLPSDGVPHGHDGWEEVKRLAGDERWESYFKFCVFRDPLDWIISGLVDQASFWWDYDPYYKMMKVALDHYLIDHPTIPNMVAIKATQTLAVDGIVTKEDVDGFINLRKYWYQPEKHIFQSDWIPDDIDMVIDFADMTGGWEKFKERTGVDFDIPWHNKSIYTEGLKYQYTYPALDYASEYFKKDIEFYRELSK